MGRPGLSGPGRTLLVTGTAAAVLGTVHTAYNLRRLRTPDVAAVAAGAAVGRERVSVLVPVRDEAASVGRCLRAVLDSHGVPDLEVLVLDDASRDGTAALVREMAAQDPRLRLVDTDDGEPPPGWLGKPWACERLAAAASGRVLVFIDADVALAPDGLAATVRLMRDAGLDLLCPYPRQEASGVAERLVQPLLQWSWLTALPLVAAERSPRASLAVANGQLLAVDVTAYRASGGHGAANVRAAVLDDIELARAVRGSGGRGTLCDGTRVATCRMYDGWPQVRDGYGKSLWTAFGSPAAGLAVAAGACVVYVVPAVCALGGSRVGAIGYAAGVAGRVLAARRVGSRVWPDVFAHPVSVAVFGALVVDSVRRHRSGSLTWKGRRLP